MSMTVHSRKLLHLQASLHLMAKLPVRSGAFAFALHNYLWPTIYAAAAAALSMGLQLLQDGHPLDPKVLGLTALAAALGFLGPRLNPTTGPGEPFLEPHVDPKA